MSEAFNPYHEWLGLSADIKAPDYYQLLSLEPFEEDRSRLTAAADRALARVRSFRPGAQAAAWARLLDELASAKSCLRDPAQKSAYDKDLRQRTAPAQAARAHHGPPLHMAPINASPDLYPPGMFPTREEIPAAAPVQIRPAPIPPALGTLAPPQQRASATTADMAHNGIREPLPPGPINAHVAPPRREPVSLLPLTAIVASVVLIVTAVMLVIALRDEAGGSALLPHDPLPASPASELSKPAFQFSKPASPLSKPGRDQPSRDGRDGGPSEFAGAPDESAVVPADSAAPAPAGSAAPAPANSAAPAPAHSAAPAPAHSATPPTADSPPPRQPLSSDAPPAVEDLAQLGKLLQQSRSALADREFRAADQALEQARGLTRTDEQKALVERLQQLSRWAERFWNGVWATAHTLRAGQELQIGSEDLLTVVVVETSRDSITIRNQGRNMPYSLSDLPAGLALAIARQSMNETDPETYVLFGAGLVTAKDVKLLHIQEARRYWKAAAESGAEVADLQAVLADSYELVP
ncbi:MAG: hypothetical protein ACYC0X_29935 [Pirellulaceae bacterium]